jgi:hypothetical protein
MAAERYAQQQRAKLVGKYGEDRVAEWESVLRDGAPAGASVVPFVRALNVVADVFGSAGWPPPRLEAVK